MSYLVDTNILLRSAEPSHPMFEPVTNAMDILPLILDAPTVFEQWERLVNAQVISLKDCTSKPPCPPSLGGSELKVPQDWGIQGAKNSWYFLFQKAPYQVKGVNVHDARLVAVMLVHGLSHILTFNVNDFHRYSSEITIINPNDIQA